jgi:predicted component of type VI protein secretion system
MALLANGGARIVLPAHCVLGRSSTCTIRLGSGQASSEHARISYRQSQESAWVLRDLSSKNGTFVNGQCLPHGGSHTLSEGDRLAFGDPAVVWILEDASAPTAMARRLVTGELLAAEDGLLALPSPAEPLATLFEAEGRRWAIELDGQLRAAEDGETIEAGGEAFVLHLPISPVSTVEAQAPVPAEEAELQFRVSRDEEAVEVAARGRVLPPRAHHHTWLTLARARLRDRESAHLAEPQRGWLFVDDLCRTLSMDENKLNVEIYRIRKDAASLGLPGAAAMIERRRASRQLRIGTDKVVVLEMDRAPGGRPQGTA